MRASLAVEGRRKAAPLCEVQEPLLGPPKEEITRRGSVRSTAAPLTNTAYKGGNMAAQKPSTTARKPLKITLSEALHHDLLIARDHLTTPEEPKGCLDDLDAALLTVTIPGELQPQLARRLAIVFVGISGEEDMPAAAEMVASLADEKHLTAGGTGKLLSDERVLHLRPLDEKAPAQT